MSEQTITLNKRGRKLPLTSELECGCKLTMHALGFTTFTFCKMHEAASTMLAALEACEWGDNEHGPRCPSCGYYKAAGVSSRSGKHHSHCIVGKAIAAARSEPAQQGTGLEVNVRLPAEDDTP
ncbi:hypothetical protein LCGC14_0445370 [marine sediment metagenome]|uniref:Uncharacterized protein n=1 Tax=marine sediment metagenome TaxID=412755 RepID=A0A0F9SJD0_9ZZZZ